MHFRNETSSFFKLSLVFFRAVQGRVYLASQCLCRFTQWSCKFLKIYITDYHQVDVAFPSCFAGRKASIYVSVNNAACVRGKGSPEHIGQGRCFEEEVFKLWVDRAIHV